MIGSFIFSQIFLHHVIKCLDKKKSINLYSFIHLEKDFNQEIVQKRLVIVIAGFQFLSKHKYRLESTSK